MHLMENVSNRSRLLWRPVSLDPVTVLGAFESLGLGCRLFLDVYIFFSFNVSESGYHGTGFKLIVSGEKGVCPFS